MPWAATRVSKWRAEAADPHRLPGVPRGFPATASIVAALVALAACDTGPPVGDSAATPAPAASPTGDPDLWKRDLTEPYPHTLPIPPRTPTPMDGVYVRTVTAAEGGSPMIPCRRCAPYRLDRGDSTLVLEAGRFRVSQPASDFSSLGHFLVRGDRLVFFNDPVCPEVRGVYRWTLRGSGLALRAVDDDCAFDDLRARYLTFEPWRERSAET